VSGGGNYLPGELLTVAGGLLGGGPANDVTVNVATVLGQYWGLATSTFNATGATVDVQTNGTIGGTTVTLNATGTGYVLNDVLNVSGAQVGGSGADWFTVNVTGQAAFWPNVAVNGGAGAGMQLNVTSVNGSISAVVSAGGAGYSNGDLVVAPSALTGNSGGSTWSVSTGAIPYGPFTLDGSANGENAVVTLTSDGVTVSGLTISSGFSFVPTEAIVIPGAWLGRTNVTDDLTITVNGTTGTFASVGTTSDGSGTGTVLTITQTNGVMNVPVTIVNGGSGHFVGDVLTVAAADVNSTTVVTLPISGVETASSNKVIVMQAVQVLGGSFIHGGAPATLASLDLTDQSLLTNATMTITGDVNIAPNGGGDTRIDNHGALTIGGQVIFGALADTGGDDADQENFISNHSPITITGGIVEGVMTEATPGVPLVRRSTTTLL
jgi:hypothetical protein